MPCLTELTSKTCSTMVDIMFSTWKERHTFLIGFFEVLCPWPSHYHLTLEQKGDIRHEYHYYMAGRALGFIALLLILIVLAKLFKEVIL